VFAYVARRLFATIVVMAVVAFVVFLLLYLTPGDPAAILAGDAATSDDISRIREKLGLDEPFLSRFGNWTSASLQIAPILLSAMLISWAMSGSQGHVPWSSYVVGACAMVYLVRYARRYARQKLEPRQRRLRELLDALDARE